jgi:hypothetical protein
MGMELFSPLESPPLGGLSVLPVSPNLSWDSTSVKNLELEFL